MSATGKVRAAYRYLWHDWSALTLLLSNLLALGFALLQEWDLGVLIWVYWRQSVIIGVFNFIKIWTLKEFSTERFTINQQPVDPTPATRYQTAIFFAFHYGFFRTIYAVFLVMQFEIPPGDLIFVGICIAGAS